MKKERVPGAGTGSAIPDKPECKKWRRVMEILSAGRTGRFPLFRGDTNYDGSFLDMRGDWRGWG